MAIIKTEGIVLKSFDFRETSRIATFFTREEGKVSGILKGIRNDPRKFGSSIDRFSVNELVYYQYRNSDLHLISQCDLKQFFYPVRQDLKKSLAVGYILELIDVIMPVEQQNRHIYQLMMDFLTTIERYADTSHLVHAFQIKTLLYSGFRPHLDACLICKKKIGGKALFSMREGGLVCPDCQVRDKEAHVISRGTVASLLHIEKSSWENCLKLALTSTVRQELKYVLNNFLVFNLGKKLKSARYLH